MFGIDSGELLIIAVVALVVIGPKDLPRAMRTIGQLMGRARGMAKHFRSGLDTMIREAEFDDMEKKWAADNERIMREHPAAAPGEEWAAPTAEAPEPAAPATTVDRASGRPKPPPARKPGTLPSGAAPPIPPVAPRAGRP